MHSPPVEWGVNQLRELLIGSVRQGPVPQHIAFVMDGNRRFARNHKIETVEGHNLGFEALAKVWHTRFERLRRKTQTMHNADTNIDLGSLLQVRSEGCHNLRLQHRKLQALEI